MEDRAIDLNAAYHLIRDSPIIRQRQAPMWLLAAIQHFPHLMSSENLFWVCPGQPSLGHDIAAERLLSVVANQLPWSAATLQFAELAL